MANEAVALYRKVAKDDAPPYGLQKLADDERLFTKPTLLCCGGRFINQHYKDGERLANGFAQIGHALLGYKETLGKADPIDIVSVSYPKAGHALLDDIHSYTSKRLKGEEADNGFAADFAKQHLFPLVEDAQGKARDLTSMKKHLRNVTLLTHSYGATFIQQAGNALADHMKELGVSDADIKDATSQVVVVSAGPTVALGGGKASFTTFNVIHKSDSEVGNLHEMHGMIKDMMAATPAATPLVVDEKNAPVHRTGRRTANERLFAKPDFVAKTLNIIPIMLKPDASKPEFVATPDSNDFIAYQSPPIWMNGIGNNIERPSRNDYGNAKDVRAGEGTKAFSPKEQESRDHQPPAYFHYNLDKDGALTKDGHTLRTLMSSVLSNSVSNAIENQGSDTFVPLPSGTSLTLLPEKVRYDMADDVNFVNTMRAKGYNDRVREAMWDKASGTVTSLPPR